MHCLGLDSSQDELQNFESRCSAASSYLTTIIGEAFEKMPKGEWVAMIRLQLKAKEEEEAKKAAAEKTASENRSIFARMLG